MTCTLNTICLFCQGEHCFPNALYQHADHANLLNNLLLPICQHVITTLEVHVTRQSYSVTSQLK